MRLKYNFIILIYLFILADAKQLNPFRILMLGLFAFTYGTDQCWLVFLFLNRLVNTHGGDKYTKI